MQSIILACNISYYQEPVQIHPDIIRKIKYLIPSSHTIIAKCKIELE